MSIKESVNKIKGYIQTVPADLKYNLFIALLIVLVGTASFGLGRLSKTSLSHGDIRILTPQNASANVLGSVSVSENTKSTQPELPENVYVGESGGEVVASKSGTKYHYPWCAGAKQISEKNKITFVSIEEARKAGYTPAANCKGLQ